MVVTAALVSGIAQAGLGAYQYFKNQQLQDDLNKKAATISKNMQARIDAMYNPLAALQVSSKKEELIKDASLQTSANVAQNLQESGAAAVMGGASGLVRSQDDTNLQNLASLDEKEAATNIKRLEGDQKLQTAQVEGSLKLAENELTGTQTALGEARGQQQMNIAGLMGGVGNIVSGAIQGSDLYKNKKTTPNTTTNPSGGTFSGTQGGGGTGVSEGPGGVYQVPKDCPPGMTWNSILNTCT